MSAAVLTSFLFAAAWKGTALVAFALVVHRVARNRIPPRWLCALLFVAIVRLLVPVAPAASFSVFNLVPADTIETAKIDVGPMPAKTVQPMRVRTAVPIPPQTKPWMSFVLALWGAGALFVIARAVLATRRFQRQLDEGSAEIAPVTTGVPQAWPTSAAGRAGREDVVALVDECRGILHVRRRVRVVVTSAVATPSLHGWMRPTLLLPAELLSNFTLEQLRYVVLHELAHLRRSDVLVNWIATAAQALHWFNPLVRLAVARFAEERELACDALALAALRAEERPAYGGTVLELVDRLRVAPVTPALVGMTATPAQLKRRIVMIASFRQNRFSIVFAALVVAVGLVTLTDASAGEPQIRRTVSHMRQPASPEVKATMQKLDTAMNVELTNASLDDVLHAVMNATGATIVIEDGALDDATRAKRLNVKASNVPAHLVLFESLGTLDLAVKFTPAGVAVQRMPKEALDVETADGAKARIFVRSIDTPPAVGEGVEEAGEVRTRERVSISAEGAPDGAHRKLRLDGATPAEQGTLEVELVQP